MPHNQTQDSALPACLQCDAVPTKVGSFWICPQHGQLPEPKPFTAQRIFLSYGHDANEPLVRRIKSDLERRGHDVWFDKSEIKAGDDWRRSITDGIAVSHKVVSFLSKHSTRDPGVCLDEVGIALGVKGGNIQTILVESETEVNPPPTVGHIQWLDMHDWSARCEQQRDDWGSWYQQKLAEIIRVVESDESRRFAGEIETLGGYLKPISSDSRIATLLRKGFVGRQWLFDAVEDWRSAACNTSRMFWITGDPGVGKSAFAAQLTHFGRDRVVAAQFIEWDKPDHRNAGRVIRSLSFQLACRFPDYRKLLLTLPEIRELDQKREAELFEYLLANPLKTVIGGGRDRYLIVVDALDEAGDGGYNPLVDMLARHSARLPEWLCLVVTSRPEIAVNTPLQGLNPSILKTKSEANLADIRDYLRLHLSTQLEDCADVERLLHQIIEKSEGVFLYAERFCEDVQQGCVSLEDPEQFPRGLGGIYYQWFQRQFHDLDRFRKEVLPALRAILTAYEPLPVEILQRLFDWQDEELHDVIRALGSLFRVTTETQAKVIKPYHKSLADWLADESKAGVFFVSLKEGRQMLVDFSFSYFKSQQIQAADSQHAQCLSRMLLVQHYYSSDWERVYKLLRTPDLIRQLNEMPLPGDMQCWMPNSRFAPGRWCDIIPSTFFAEWDCRKCGRYGDTTEPTGMPCECPYCKWGGRPDETLAYCELQKKWGVGAKAVFDIEGKLI